MKTIIKAESFLYVVLALLLSCSNPIKLDVETEKDSIRSVLFQQQDAWNKGDIPSFMNGYKKGEDLMFIGSSGIYKGWENTLKRYTTSYSTREKMGTLNFEILDIKVFNDSNAHLIGKFALKNQQDSVFASGHYTLLWEKIGGEWRIIMDQTCG